MTTDRANPLANLDDFAPVAPAKPVRRDEIDRLSNEVGFPSRQAQPMVRAGASTMSQPGRWNTGRNKQINIKATDETIARLTGIARELDVPIAEAFERAVAALETEYKRLLPRRGLR